MSDFNVTTPSPLEIKMTRTFQAPLRIVRRAMTEPALVKKWLGGKRATVVNVENDLRVGGSYLQQFKNRDGSEFSFTGVYSEVSDERIVHTELFNGQPPPAVVTTTLVEDGGKTTMTVVMRFDSQEIRDMVIGTGMADGAGESYDALAALLPSL